MDGVGRLPVDRHWIVNGRSDTPIGKVAAHLLSILYTHYVEVIDMAAPGALHRLHNFLWQVVCIVHRH
jgi:hypothetical protein